MLLLTFFPAFHRPWSCVCASLRPCVSESGNHWNGLAIHGHQYHRSRQLEGSHGKCAQPHSHQRLQSSLCSDLGRVHLHFQLPFLRLVTSFATANRGKLCSVTVTPISMHILLNNNPLELYNLSPLLLLICLLFFTALSAVLQPRP